jgi:hypothetical protein
LIPEAPADHQIEREFLAKGRPSSLLQWMIEPEEIANPIAYVASPCLQRPMAPPCAWMVVSHLRSANQSYGKEEATIRMYYRASRARRNRAQRRNTSPNSQYYRSFVMHAGLRFIDFLI